MNRVEITTNGPVMENLCEVEVSDDYALDKFYLDNADVLRAQSEGHEAVLNLILENCGGAGSDILRSALGNGSPVSIDGDTVTEAHLSAALGLDGPTP